ncbi:MAG TPA: hypothetical protein VHE35_14290 [Kofleriaceae bacterium]|nr:hypothetical protein [Kofleriaceae bacterium]
MSARGRHRRRRGALAAAAVALAGCAGARNDWPLPPAGSGSDDGAGQLAQASVQLRLEGGDDDDNNNDAQDTPPPREGRAAIFGTWAGGAGYGADPSLSGSVYGLDGSAGGAMYAYGSGPPFGITGPSLPPRTDGGAAAVVGVVTWRGDRGIAWPAGCAGARVAHAGGATEGALVYLANAPLRHGPFDDERWTPARGAIEADGCALWPPAQMVGPAPGMVDVENASAEPLSMTIGSAAVELEPGADWRLPVQQVGVIRVDAGTRAPAWVLGENHDYFTVTDALGRFALDGVPAGTYDLVVWYPPLVRAMDGDRPQWTDATAIHRRVTVGATGAVRVAVALDPAP